MGRSVINSDLQNPVISESHRIYVTRYYSTVDCGVQMLKSFGYPTTGLPCTSTAYCQDFWPLGASYELRDTKAVCCNDASSEGFGECGQWV